VLRSEPGTEAAWCAVPPSDSTSTTSSHGSSDQTSPSNRRTCERFVGCITTANAGDGNRGGGTREFGNRCDFFTQRGWHPMPSAHFCLRQVLGPPGLRRETRHLGVGAALTTQKTGAQVAALAVNPHSPAATLIKPRTDPLRDAGVNCLSVDQRRRGRPRQLPGHPRGWSSASCGQSKLTDAVRAGTQRPMGGAVGWVRRGESVDGSPLRAATLAAWLGRIGHQSGSR
jgi:hypothetical protein